MCLGKPGRFTLVLFTDLVSVSEQRVFAVGNTGMREAAAPEQGVSEFLCKRFGFQFAEIRSLNSMVKRVSAAFQSRMGMAHFWLML